MVTEFSAIVKAVELSKKSFPNEVVVVFKKADGNFDACVESEFLGEDEQIYERYLNGTIVPV